MFRRIRRLLWLPVIASLLLSVFSVGFARAARLPGKALEGVTVCYFVEIGFQNTSTTRQTVDAYVMRLDTFARTAGPYSFSLDGGKSGGFHMVFQIPNPYEVPQVLIGSWYTNSNMQITSYNEDYLSLDDCTGNVFNDGRLNDGEDQKAAPVVVYCEGDDITVYDIDEQSRGNLVFRVSLNDVAAGLKAAVADGAATVLGEGGGDTLYALPSNELQINGPELFTGKDYHYIFAGDVCGTPDS